MSPRVEGTPKRRWIRGPSWATAAIPFVILGVLAGLRTAEGENSSYKIGAIVGSLIGALVLAVILRFLWVKIVRRGRRPLRSPWLLVIAANVALLMIFVDVGEEIAHCEEAPTAATIFSRAPERGSPASAELMAELRRNIADNDEQDLRDLAAHTYGDPDEPTAVAIVFLSAEELDPEEFARGFGAGANATPRKVDLGSEQGWVIDVPDGVAVLGLPHACAAATVIAGDRSTAILLATALVEG